MNIYKVYLHAAWAFGFVGHVRKLSDKWWNESVFGKKADAALSVSDLCWPLSFTDEEIEDMQRHSAASVAEHRRREREIEFYGYDHRIPWYEQPDGSSALLALPDGKYDRMFQTT